MDKWALILKLWALLADKHLGSVSKISTSEVLIDNYNNLLKPVVFLNSEDGLWRLVVTVTKIMGPPPPLLRHPASGHCLLFVYATAAISAAARFL
jgi:hypothetical protein